MIKSLIILALFLLQEILAQAYYPLSISNKWYYETSWGSEEFYVTKDTVVDNGSVYYKLNQIDFAGGQFVRVDSVYVYYYNLETEVEDTAFILNGEIGDETNPKESQIGSIIVAIDTITIFNEQTKVITYNLYDLRPTQIKLSEKFGIVSASFYDDPPPPWPLFTYDLKGCYLDNTKYGTLTLVEKNTLLPTNLILYQNYPNPFNPMTKLSFKIPEQTTVKLSVFNLNGELVEEILNDKISAGKYEYLFTASQLSSGIYFYQLKTNKTIITRKMILLK